GRPRHRLPHRPREFCKSERDHGDVFPRTLSRARRGRRGVAAARLGGGNRRGHALGVTPAAAPPAVRSRLEKLGIRSSLDLVLHLPLRYEDETKLTPIKNARAGVPVLVEAEVVESDVKYRPRR